MQSKKVAEPKVTQRIIKKYPNRRLYDTDTSSYITLAQVKRLVMDSEPFVVMDVKTGEDLTRSILLQIILEEESNDSPMFTAPVLASVIRFYGHAMQGFMGGYLEKNMQQLMDVQAKFAEQSKGLSPEMWTQFMALQSPVLQSMLGGKLEQSKNLFEQMQEQMQKQTGQMLGAFGINAGTIYLFMSEVITKSNTAPKVGFVSLGCAKALTDSELILTQLSAEGYQTSKTFEGADLVIVNTCGFIDDAVKESLDTIGEALAENGKVIVTGCLGAKTAEGGDNLVRQVHPSVLAVTGPQATQEVMDAVHANLPKPHDPFIDLVPNAFGVAGIKLTPRHYAYIKISEGCNHRCTFCIIPSMRGDLVSRPIGDVLKEARALFEGGVKELLVISQDTSAYGVDVKYRTGFWDGKPTKTRLLELAAALGDMAEPYGAWVRLHYVYPYPSVDDLLPLMAAGKVLPYLDVPLQHSHPEVLKRMKRPASDEKNLERIQRWREVCPDIVVRSTFIAGFPGETEEEFSHLLDFMREAQIDRAGCFAYSPVQGAVANDIGGMLPIELREERRARFMAVAEAVSSAKLQQRIGATMQVLVDSAPGLGKKGGLGRSYADAPEIDGVVKLLPPEKISKTLRVGEFTKARIVGAQGHDLVAQPF